MSTSLSPNSSNFPNEVKKEEDSEIVVESNHNSEDSLIINNDNDYSITEENNQMKNNINNNISNNNNNNKGSSIVTQKGIIYNINDLHLIEPHLHKLRNLNTKHSNTEKLDIDQLTYSLMKNYSQLKIPKEEEFMSRMEFDVYKRHMQSKHIAQLLEDNKTKMSEEDKVKTFNRLIEDTNRRLAAKECLNAMKEKIDSEIPLSPSKTYKTFQWNEVYDQRFKKYNEENIKKREQRQNEERIKRELKERKEEAEMVKAKKEPWKVIQKSIDHLYEDSKLRTLQKKDTEYDSYTHNANKKNPLRKTRNYKGGSQRKYYTNNYNINIDTTNNTNNNNNNKNHSKTTLTDNNKLSLQQFSFQSLIKESCCEIQIDSNSNKRSERKCKFKKTNGNNKKQTIISLRSKKKKRTKSSYFIQIPDQKNSNNNDTKPKKFNQLEAQPKDFAVALPLRQLSYHSRNDNSKQKLFKNSLSPDIEGNKKAKDKRKNKDKQIEKNGITIQKKNNNKNNVRLQHYTIDHHNDNKIVDYFFMTKLKHLKAK